MPLVAHYPLQETGGGPAYDVRNGNNGTLNGGVTQGATGLLGTSAYSFDGTDDYVEFPISSITLPVTVSYWIKPDDVTTGESVFSNFNSTGDDWFNNINRDGDGTVRLLLDAGGDLTAPSNTVSANEWNHIVTPIGGGTGKIYADGVEIVSGTGFPSNGSTIDNGYNFRIGLRVQGDFPLLGDMADVRIYDHALTPLEVQYLYEVVAGPSQLTTNWKAV